MTTGGDKATPPQGDARDLQPQGGILPLPCGSLASLAGACLTRSHLATLVLRSPSVMYLLASLELGRMRCVATPLLRPAPPPQNPTPAHTPHTSTYAAFGVAVRRWDGVPPDSIRELGTSAAFFFVHVGTESRPIRRRRVVFLSLPALLLAPFNHNVGRSPARVANGAARQENGHGPAPVWHGRLVT